MEKQYHQLTASNLAQKDLPDCIPNALKIVVLSYDVFADLNNKESRRIIVDRLARLFPS